MMLPRLALGVLTLAFLGSAANAAASPISVAYTDPVTSWEWAEVAELKNLVSWDDVNTVCAEDGVTACAGTLEEKEFDGWIWATSDQVRDLFVNATDELTPSMLAADAKVFDSVWAPQFLELFTPTDVSSGDPSGNFAYEEVFGLSASTDAFDNAHTPWMKDVLSGCDCGFNFDFGAPFAIGPKDVQSLGGVWLHRPAETAVVTPEPASLLLMGSGLLVGIRRYRKNRS